MHPVPFFPSTEVGNKYPAYDQLGQSLLNGFEAINYRSWFVHISFFSSECLAKSPTEKVTPCRGFSKMHEKYTHVTYKSLSSGQSPVVAFNTRQCLTALLPWILRGQLFKHSSLNVSKKRAHCSTMMPFEPSRLFPGPTEHVQVWVGSSHSPIIGLFAHIHAKYLTNDFFCMFLILHKFGLANPKLWQRLSMLGKGLLTSASRRNWARENWLAFPCCFQLFFISILCNSILRLICSCLGMVWMQ